MKIKRRYLAGVLIILVVLVGAFGAVQMSHSHGHAAHPQNEIYYCPMHPTFTSSKPGNCPICSMKLVKREKGPVQPPLSQESKTSEEICVLHNCAKLHEGRPCPMVVVSKPGEEVTCPICGTHVVGSGGPSEKRILYWTDPMMPGYRSDKPGKSPMGMDLVPVYGETQKGGLVSDFVSPEGHAAILLSPQKQQLIGVTSARAEKRKMTKTIRTAGRIAYDPELYQAQQEYIQTLQVLKQKSALPEMANQTQRLADAARTRLRLLGLSDASIQEMDGWEGPDESLLLTHPAGRAWLYAQVYEMDISSIQVGQAVRVEVPAIPGKTFEAVVRSVDPVLDPTTRSVRVRALLSDPERVLRPGMYVHASLITEIGEVLSVPSEAVLETGTRQLVFVDKGQGLFEPREVTIGHRADGFYEVKEGLTEGETVVTSGNFLIDSESRLKSALEGMGPSEGGGEGGGAHRHGQ